MLCIVFEMFVPEERSRRVRFRFLRSASARVSAGRECKKKRHAPVIYVFFGTQNIQIARHSQISPSVISSPFTAPRHVNGWCKKRHERIHALRLGFRGVIRGAHLFATPVHLNYKRRSLSRLSFDFTPERLTLKKKKKFLDFSV